MDLDIRTLQVATIVVCCVLGPISLAFGSGKRYSRPSRFWGAALIALACGLALVSLQGHGPNTVLQVIGFSLFALALTFAQACARSARDQNARDVLGWTLLALFVLALLALEKISASAWLRHFLGMGLIGLLACSTAYGFFRCRELNEGGPLRVIAVMFSVAGVVLVLQGAFGAPHQGAAPGSTEMDALMLVGLIAGLLLGTIVLLWVMTERIARRMRELVSLDPLTGALNRPAFIEFFEREVSRTQRRSNSRFAMMLLDVDHFRRINDAHGHDAGDRVLLKTVEVLRATIRRYDQIGRLEGDAFVLLLPGTWGESATSMAERARQEIERQVSVLAGLNNPVSVSVGVAVFGEHGEDWDSMLRAADAAMRVAEAFGGNRIEIAAPMAS